MKQFLLLALLLFSWSVSAQTHSELIIKNKIDHISTLAREPMVCQHPNGDLYVTGYRNQSNTPQLWKSVDMGKTWASVDVGTPEEGAKGNSDADLYIDSVGNIYLLSMTYTKLPADLKDFDFSTLKGERITVGVSKDEDKTWKWHQISENDYDNRPWITATYNGDLHIIWNDGKGVHHTISQDKGASWEKKGRIAEKGGSSFLASGYNGELAVRITPLSASGNQYDKGVDYTQLSRNNGASWKEIKLPGNRVWNADYSEGVPRWVEPLAWDETGKLYALWSEGQTLKLGVTDNYGDSWQEHLIMQNVDTLYYPYMKMGKQGLLCTWLSGFKNNIKHHATVIELEKDTIQTHTLEAQKVDIWSRFETQTYERSTGGEYFPIIPLANGNIGMITTIQNSKANRKGFTWWELILNRF